MKQNPNNSHTFVDLDTNRIDPKPVLREKASTVEQISNRLIQNYVIKRNEQRTTYTEPSLTRFKKNS